MSSVESSADSSPYIHLAVKAQNGNQICFKMKRSARLRKLMDAFCARQSLQFETTVFLFDGRVIRPEQTPDELKMEDGDEIDAMMHQTGGVVAACGKDEKKLQTD